MHLPAAEEIPLFTSKARILFQGDSITDGNRGRSADPNHILGHGYAFIIAAQYGAALPERQLTFMNRGISGNTVSDLAKRWQKETIDLKPDVLSILIGVNDLGKNVPADEYEKQYDALLTQTTAAVPNTRLVLCEPFGLPSGKKKEEWAAYYPELQKRQAIVAKLAVKHRAILVPLQKPFEEASKNVPAEYWIWDGVHPTYSGHQLIADAWVKAVRGN
ncbi:MAG: SGNH/GDSL hydrolase family protein [Burkholderiales bacterium]|nr:SGNH/GDSL hydrolase family protein [Phycisphaerae bacterium]